MTRSEMLAYAAGIIDGEGCISLSDNGPDQRRRSFSPILTVGMADPEAIGFLESLWGVPSQDLSGRPSLKASKNRKLYMFRPKTAQIEPILLEILPYLTVKRAQAELVLEFIVHKRASPQYRGRDIPEEIVEYRRNLFWRCSAHKKRNTWTPHVDMSLNTVEPAILEQRRQRRRTYMREYMRRRAARVNS